MEPRYNEPLYNEVLDIANDFLYSSNSKMYEKNFDITKPRYSEHILPVPWPFVISRFHSVGEYSRDQYYWDAFVIVGWWYSVYGAPKRTLWQRPHLVPVHFDEVW